MPVSTLLRLRLCSTNCESYVFSTQLFGYGCLHFRAATLLSSAERLHQVGPIPSAQRRIANGLRRSSFPLQLDYYLGPRSHVLLVGQADWGGAPVLRKQVDQHHSRGHLVGHIRLHKGKQWRHALPDSTELICQ